MRDYKSPTIASVNFKTLLYLGIFVIFGFYLATAGIADKTVQLTESVDGRLDHLLNLRLDLDVRNSKHGI